MSNQILGPIYSRIDDRGAFHEILRDLPWKSIITGEMHKDSELGNHYHKQTLLFFFLTSGSAEINIVSIETNEVNRYQLVKNQGIFLRQFHAHRIRFHEESSFILLKSRSYDPQDPDTYRFDFNPE